MALETGLFITLRMLHHARPCTHTPARGRASVGIVAVRTLNDSFVDAMLKGHIELGTDGTVAVIAKLCLLLREETLLSLRSMNGVTGRADDIGLCMTGAPNLGTIEVPAVTAEAVIENLFRPKLGKRDDGVLPSTGLNVCFAGPMTAFASGVLRRSISCCQGPKMRILVEIEPHIRMAGTARVASDVTRGGSLGNRRSRRLLRGCTHR